MPWALPTSDAERLTLAKSYPFAAPGRPYLFRAGRAEPLDAAGSRALDFSGRVPVIAHGSNRAPDQLARKFGTEAEIPVSRALLADYDVVYSAHVTRYGSIAANLQHAPGVRAEVYVTWLDEAQLARMHETELGTPATGPGNYRYGRLEGIALELEAGPAERLDAAFVYLSRRGCLADDDKADPDAPGARPLGLAEIAAQGRTHRALGQREVLGLVHRRFHPDRPLDPLILETVRDAALRAGLIERLGAGALPVSAPHFRVLEG